MMSMALAILLQQAAPDQRQGDPEGASGDGQQGGDVAGDAGRNLAEQQRPHQRHGMRQRQPGATACTGGGSWSVGKNTPDSSTMGVMNSVK
jgi:hypothetical protein